MLVVLLFSARLTDTEKLLLDMLYTLGLVHVTVFVWLYVVANVLTVYVRVQNPSSNEVIPVSISDAFIIYTRSENYICIHLNIQI